MGKPLKGLALIHEESDTALRPRRLGVDAPRVTQWAEKAADQLLATPALVVEALDGLTRGAFQVRESEPN
eukprot:1055622-Alexandrium_andersonii.AAC.1